MFNAQFKWLQSPDQEFPDGFRIWSIAKRAAIHSLITSMVPEMLQWVRANAPWTDRTGMARSLFYINVEQTTLAHEIFFNHGVFYGLYLETHNGGNFSIVDKALDYWGPEVMDAIQGLFDD